MNPPSVSTIVDWPEPTANSVPEAHAPPSCIPTANRAAPANSGTPIGPGLTSGVAPNSPTPVATISMMRVAAVPSSSACARMPSPLPTPMSCRQAEVNPKREWNSATPRKTPISSRAAKRSPCPAHTYQADPAASRPETTSGAVRTGPSGAGRGGGHDVGEVVRRSRREAGSVVVDMGRVTPSWCAGDGPTLGMCAAPAPSIPRCGRSPAPEVRNRSRCAAVSRAGSSPGRRCWSPRGPGGGWGNGRSRHGRG